MKLQKQLQTKISIMSGEWKIVGDLLMPEADTPAPVVILLNQAAGNRMVYSELATLLAKQGIGSLRIDLRGHGESINLGRFVPGEGISILKDTENDISAAYIWITLNNNVDPRHIGFVGASYSGEAMMEAGRINGYGAAYVALSPGSLSGDSIAAIDRENLPWLLVVSRQDPYLPKIVQAFREESHDAELMELGGKEHGTDLLETKAGLAEHIAVWLRHKLVDKYIDDRPEDGSATRE